MKKNIAYTIGSIIVLLISAFCFIALPAFTGNSSNQQGYETYGKYGKKAITNEPESIFTDYVNRYVQLYQQYGQQIDQSSYFRILNNAFNATVLNYAYKDEVKSSGYVVPKSAVNRQILPYFYDENGKYSSKLYKQTPDKTKAKIVKSTEDSLTADRFYSDNFGSSSEMIGNNSLFGLKVAENELNFVADMDTERRGFSMALFPMGDYPSSEKASFGKAHAEKFNKYDMSVITVEEKSTASTVVKRIANKELTFEDAVSEYSDKKYSDTQGKLAGAYQYQIENILENKDDFEKVSSTAKDDVSEVIATKSGFSIFKNNGPVEKADFDTEVSQQAVYAYLTTYESTVIEDYFTDKAIAFVADAMKGNFEQACKKHSVKSYTIAPFPLNYGNLSILGKLDTSVSGLSNADSNENFLKTAFTLKKGEISKPIVLNNNVIVLKYTTSENKSAESPDANKSQFASYDEESARNSILSSSKVKNNVMSVYFNSMIK